MVAGLSGEEQSLVTDRRWEMLLSCGSCSREVMSIVIPSAR